MGGSFLKKAAQKFLIEQSVAVFVLGKQSIAVFFNLLFFFQKEK
jgi:hypothetical protein